MTKNSRPTDPALAELYDQMISRDHEMWQRLTERDSKLQDGMMELFSRMLDNSSLDRVMVNGFTAVSDQLKEQLAPLRDLTPNRAPLDDDQKALLKSLRLALTRPNYSLSPGDVPGRLVTTDSGNKGSFAS
jgi:hypothetical protein